MEDSQTNAKVSKEDIFSAEDKSESEKLATGKSDEHNKIVATEEIVKESKQNMTEDLPEIISVEKIEKIDELSSLEREIAEMHHVEPAIADADAKQACNSVVDGAPEDAMNADGNNEKIISPDPQISIPIKHTKFETNENTLKDEDLIAVLKGTDTNTSADCELPDGVTIEGEGEYPIMEIDDDIIDDELQLNAIVERKSNNKVKMSLEQERAVAMEQIAGLKKKPNIRRKQQDAPSTELVSSLNADWSEYDSGSEVHAGATALKVPKQEKKSPNDNKMATARSPDKAKVTSVVMITTAKTSPTKIITNPTPNPDNSSKKIVANIPAPAQPEVAPVTGFKRTRIIKRKIIWDPDDTETQKSYSQYASSKAKNNVVRAPHMPTPPPPPPKSTTSRPKTPVAVSSKKEPVAKKPRPATPKTAVEEKKPKRATTPHTPRRPVTESAKKRSQTPNILSMANGSAKKKKNSEIDRLMGDEGAANMINELEHQREISGDANDEKLDKPTMRSRRATICGRPPKLQPLEVATTSASPTKEAQVSPKQKRVPVTKQKASESWDYVYQQQASDDAMIIRRRSNSSYSSNASLHRSSLDGGLPMPKNNTATASTSVTSDNNVPVDTPLNTSTSINNSKPHTPVVNSFEFAMPENKTTQKTPRRTKTPTPGTFKAEMKLAVRNEKVKSSNKESSKPSVVDVDTKHYGKVAHVLISTPSSQVDYTFSIHVLNKLIDTLNRLEKSADCNTVVITKNTPQFLGVDLHDLLAGSLEKRKNNAIQLAAVVKNYLKTLSTFPKPIIVGISGHIKNLGVMQLPLFDFVICSDKCTFETPYAKLGQLPEGFCFWNNSNEIEKALKTKLFLLCDKVNIIDCHPASSGFINKLTIPTKVNEDALAIAIKISNTSADTYRMMKKYTITKNMKCFTTLDDEFNTIVEQWCSFKVLENLKKN